MDIKAYLNNRLFRIIFISGFILIVVFFFLLSQTINQKSVSNLQSVTPTPAIPLQITNILPPEDTNRISFPIQQIEVDFNKPVNPQGIQITTEPTTQIKVRQKENDNSAIIISADPMWQKGITVIKIGPDTTSSDGTKFNDFYIYKLNTNLPQNADDQKNL